MAKSRRIRRFKVGSRIGEDLTVLGVIDDSRGGHPVYIVWKHSSWCPAACKVVRNARRAREEAEAMAAFTHPNIVRLLDAHGDILVMEFLEGPNLEILRRERPGGRLPLSNALRSMIHIGAALEHIHGKGYVHLDIKPQNVIVSGGKPILFDFGTARKIGGPRPSYGVGTYHYMPPEEAELGEATPASDVFSLGVSLYELLTGKLPYSRRTRLRPYPQLTELPPPPRAHLKSLPRALDDLIMACLARDPAERPPLRRVLPELNGMIRNGPRMWPEEFDPAAARRRRPHAIVG